MKWHFLRTALYRMLFQDDDGEKSIIPASNMQFLAIDLCFIDLVANERKKNVRVPDNLEVLFIQEAWYYY